MGIYSQSFRTSYWHALYYSFNFKVVLRLFETVGAKVGPSLSKLETIPFRTTSDPLDTPVSTFLAGDKEIEFDGDYESDGFIFVKQDQPLPLSVLAIYPELVTSDG